MTGKSSSEIDTRPAVARSAVRNGKRLFVEKIDGRTAPARRFRDLLLEIVNDLGGVDALSAIQMQLVRRFASLSVEAEVLEMTIAEGKPLDVETYGVIVSAQARLAGQLGLHRKMKLVPPIDDYLSNSGHGGTPAEPQLSGS